MGHLGLAMSNAKYQTRNGGDDLVDEYTTKYSAPLDVTQGFNGYVERQEECRDFFADAQQPITDTQLAAKGQLNVGQTGLFCKKYLKWKRRNI
eukprot:13601341-Ditylum_brightwellii.AAC.1